VSSTSATGESAVFSREELERVGTDVLVGLCAPLDIAECVAKSLVLANLFGHDSHGVVRLSQYAGWVADGQIQPKARPEVAQRRGAIAIIDGHWAFGQPSAHMATALSTEQCAEHGISGIAIRNCNHIGRVGEYVTAIAEAGFMGLAVCNSGPAVAPFGGTGRVMGTNPFAWSVPRAGGAAMVLDFATSIVAEGKLNIARSEGRLVSPEYVLDVEGRPTVDPNDYFAGGALVPFGLHKGSGMSMLIELTGGLLSQMGTSPASNFKGGNGTLILALDVGLFEDLTQYIDEVEQFCALAKAPGPGYSGSEVLVPGESEARTAAARTASGIPVNDEIRRQITEVADASGVDVGRFRLGR